MEFSTKWKRSKQSRKQRRYRYNAPLHIKQKFVKAHLSKELRKKYKKRAIGIKKGDTVKVVRGDFKGHLGKVIEVNLKDTKIYVEGVEITRKDGTKVRRALDPSNLIITELNLDDKIRQKILER